VPNAVFSHAYEADLAELVDARVSKPVPQKSVPAAHTSTTLLQINYHIPKAFGGDYGQSSQDLFELTLRRRQRLKFAQDLHIKFSST